MEFENEISNIKAELVRLNPEIEESSETLKIPLSANTWVENDTGASISCDGLTNWTSPHDTCNIYLHVNKTIKIDLALFCRVAEGKSTIEVKVDDVPVILELTGTDYHLVPVGRYRIFGSGYLKVSLKGICKTGDYFADVSHIVVPKNKLPENAISFIKGECDDDTYWHRRGPSIHLQYNISKECRTAEYYYCELKVPLGYDVVGSFFMAVGFNHGYFGIQVNSDKERRVLFSVWSPQDTDDPNQVLADNKVLPMRNGDGVIIKVFGNEGTGGQSYLKFDWTADRDYKFLLQARPDPSKENYTLYSAWFGEKDSLDWKLIAEFSRPKTKEFLSGFHSFVESFRGEHSSKCRKALFHNQWVRDTSGQWFEVILATITGDATAKEKVRLDFEGGVEHSGGECHGFYLKHCGFFSGACNLSTRICREPKQHPPILNYEQLK